MKCIIYNIILFLKKPQTNHMIHLYWLDDQDDGIFTYSELI